MEHKELADLTNEELLEEKKKIQYNKIANATLIGVCIGVFIYSAVKNGFGFFTFFPLFLTYPFLKNGKKNSRIRERINIS